MANQASSKFHTVTRIEEVLESSVYFVSCEAQIHYIHWDKFLSFFQKSSIPGCHWKKDEGTGRWLSISQCILEWRCCNSLGFFSCQHVPLFWWCESLPQLNTSSAGQAKTVYLGHLNTNWLYVCSTLWLQVYKPWNFSLLCIGWRDVTTVLISSYLGKVHLSFWSRFLPVCYI